MKIQRYLFLIFLYVQNLFPAEGWALIFDNKIQINLGKVENINGLVFEIANKKRVKVNGFEVDFSLFKIDCVSGAEKSIFLILLLKELNAESYNNIESCALIVLKRCNSKMDYCFPIFINKDPCEAYSYLLMLFSEPNDVIKFIDEPGELRVEKNKNVIYIFSKNDIEEEEKAKNTLDDYVIVSPDEKSYKKPSSAVEAGKMVASGLRWVYNFGYGIYSEIANSPQDD